jgi:hypothetical protein
MVRKQFRVVICGSRNFNDYVLLKNRTDKFLSGITELSDLSEDPPEVVILSGCAAGADTLGELYAEERKLTIEKHPALWDFYGKKAGYVRNEEMVKLADAVIAFWDGKSKGTLHTINLATKQYKKPTEIINYKNIREQ